LLLCFDVQCMGITRSVLNPLSVTPRIVASSEEALARIEPI